MPSIAHLSCVLHPSASLHLPCYLSSPEQAHLDRLLEGPAITCVHSTLTFPDPILRPMARVIGLECRAHITFLFKFQSHLERSLNPLTPCPAPDPLPTPYDLSILLLALFPSHFLYDQSRRLPLPLTWIPAVDFEPLSVPPHLPSMSPVDLPHSCSSGSSQT